MGWWKADPVAEGKPSPIPSSAASTQTPVAPHPIAPGTTASECPVDPKTRSIWLQAAKANQQPISNNENPTAQSRSRPSIPPTAVAPPQECSSDRVDQSLPTTSSHTQPRTYQPGSLRPLSDNREVSSIPRAYLNEIQTPNLPSNSETETGHDKPTGNWIYPSETQFFNAVMRKQTSTDPKDLATSISSIIPIHNAVNERAWYMIRAWEGTSSDKCGGPKLLRFEGKGAGAKSPRAWMKSWSGYTEPFDRHDWTVQRCDGTEVEYVIDFYQGKSGLQETPKATSTAADGFAGAGAGPGINFYLDVRPKLNSVEGCRMRLEKAVGWR